MVGEHKVTIIDVSPTVDFPNNAPETLEQASIEFTLYVEDDAAPIGSLNFDGVTGSLLRLETAKSIEPIHTHFDLSDDELANKSIRYKVTQGSGLLYVGTPTREDITPVSDLTIHKDASVYLKVNKTNNEVVAAIAGQDLRTHGKTLVFAYTGSGGPPTRRPTNNPVIPPITTASTLTLSSSTLTGTASTSVPLAATVRNSNGNPVAGIGVTFTLSVTGSGAILTPVAITNTSGVAQTNVILPNTNAVVTVTATVSGASLTQQASITVTGVAPETSTPDTPTVSEPATIEIYDGDDQEGEVNRRLDEDLVVQVLDRNNNGVSFELVRFRVVEGSGRVSPSTARTDRDGLADVTFTPRSQGTIEVEAYLGDLTPVTFTITTGEPPDANCPLLR